MSHQADHPASNVTFEVKDFTLKDGQTVWFAKDPELEIVTIGLCFKYAGSQSNPIDKPGLSSFLVAMLDEGAGPYDSQAFQKKLIEKNVQLGITSNQDNITVIFKTTTTNIVEAFQLVKLALTAPTFAPDAFTRIQQQMAASLMQSLHRPEVIAKEKILSMILGDDHPYAKDTAKQIEALPKITAADLSKQLAKTITQSNLNIAVAGNIEESVLQKCLDDLISSLPKAEAITQSPTGKLQNAGKIGNSQMDVPQTIIMFAHPGIDRKDPDFYAAFLLVQILGGNAFESRLWKEIREKRGLAYFVSLGLFSQSLQYGMLGATGTKTASAQEAIQLIREQWQDVATHGVTTDELVLQKQYLNESYPLTFTSTSGIVSALLSYQNDGLTKDYINQREELFNRVSIDDIKRVAKRLLKTDELTFLIVGQKE